MINYSGISEKSQEMDHSSIGYSFSRNIYFRLWIKMVVSTRSNRLANNLIFIYLHCFIRNHGVNPKPKDIKKFY